MSEYDVYAKILKIFGTPKPGQQLSDMELSAYSAKLPKAHLEFLRHHGIGGYAGGRFWVCSPADLQPVIDDVFKTDRDFRPANLMVLGYGALGNLICWQSGKNSVFVDFDLQEVFSTYVEPAQRKNAGSVGSDDFGIGLTIQHAIQDPNGRTVFDAAGDDLMELAIQKLGPLAPGEIYGFVPALQFGGDPELQNMRKVAVREHLLFLAQISSFNLVVLSDSEPGHPYGQMVRVRSIGGQQ